MLVLGRKLEIASHHLNTDSARSIIHSREQVSGQVWWWQRREGHDGRVEPAIKEVKCGHALANTRHTPCLLCS